MILILLLTFTTGATGNALPSSVQNEKVQLIQQLLNSGELDVNEADYDGDMLLHLACWESDPALLDLLLQPQWGASLMATNRMKRTPLDIAISFNNELFVRKLVAAGSPIEARDSAYGNTAVHAAAFNDCPEILRFFKESGADMEATNNAKETPLQTALKYGMKATVLALLDLGVDVNHTELASKDSPLHCAIKHGRLEIARMLVNRGADLNLKNENEGTPLEMVLKFRFYHTLKPDEDEMNLIELLVKKLSMMEPLELPQMPRKRFRLK